MFDLLDRFSATELTFLVVVLGTGLLLLALIVMGFWSLMHASGVQARLTRDLLARGLSVEEVERLTQSPQERQARVEADQKVRQAQVAADLKRDLLARGLSAEQVRQLTEDNTEQGYAEPAALASVLVNMVRDGSLDRDAVAGLLFLVLKRQAKGIDLTADLDDLLARGLSIEQVRQLNETTTHRANEEALALANVLVNMVSEDGELDRNAIAQLLSFVLKRQGKGIDLAADLDVLSAKAKAGNKADLELVSTKVKAENPGG